VPPRGQSGQDFSEGRLEFFLVKEKVAADLLNGLRSNFRTFSECAVRERPALLRASSALQRALIDDANYLDFDSAIPRFESWHPSQESTR